jgi:hypothetical protein
MPNVEVDLRHRRRWHQDAGIGVRHINRPEPAGQLGDSRFDCDRIRDVGFTLFGSPSHGPDLVDQRLEMGALDADGRDVSPFGSGPNGRGPSDACPCAGDEHHATGEPHPRIVPIHR